MLLALGLSGTALLWAGYRRAAPAARRAALWFVLGLVLLLSWEVLWISLLLLARTTDAALALRAYYAVEHSLLPVAWFVPPTGFAAGLLYSGAFDVRPLIGRTTVYAALLLASTFLFAGVEELVESLLVPRLGLPESAATWFGAGALALVFGPLHARLTALFKRLTHADVPAATAETAAAPAR